MPICVSISLCLYVPLLSRIHTYVQAVLLLSISSLTSHAITLTLSVMSYDRSRFLLARYACSFCRSVLASHRILHCSVSVSFTVVVHRSTRSVLV
ncbi:hypothetical protein PYCCODRAFT_112078 [Trametes coccinea BRFM310]|uniref:Uncharacterized protein n=1 Tax=Trametes coccinea (strain BRFM310) TaxID=1353009 RepID=A0A1Y2IVB8_TRAC3|nr:hypothetical protein PYCCODRAFT_112078 [Trametes coccinea BRFM310]